MVYGSGGWPPAGPGAPAPADSALVRRSNLSLVLRRFRNEGPRTRARVADETGLNKATVSSLVAELVDRGLLREGQIERLGAVGRPGQVIELDGRRVCGIGIEVNVDYVTALIVDLGGRVVADGSHADLCTHEEYRELVLR